MITPCHSTPIPFHYFPFSSLALFCLALPSLHFTSLHFTSLPNLAKFDISYFSLQGDPNIPATKITFKANISQVVTHSEINELYSSSLEENQNEVAVTEFRLPDGYDSEYNAFPNEVRTRYSVNTV